MTNELLWDGETENNKISDKIWEEYVPCEGSTKFVETEVFLSG